VRQLILAGSRSLAPFLPERIDREYKPGVINLGAADVGGMAGWFHEDIVAGVFVTASVLGTGLRAEVAFTVHRGTAS